MPIPSLTPDRQDTLADNYLGHLKDIYLLFLQQYFNQNPRGKGRFHFSASDASESEMTITDAHVTDQKVLEHRPALVILRGPVAWGRIGLDQLMKLDFRTGRRTHTDLLSGTFTIHCISRRGLEAERLSSEVSFAVKSLRRVLQEKGLFEAGQDVQMGAESPAGGLVQGDVDPHTISIPVYSPFHIQMTWTNEPVDFRKLEGVRIQLRATTKLPRRRGEKIVELDKVNTTVHIVGQNQP